MARMVAEQNPTIAPPKKGTAERIGVMIIVTVPFIATIYAMVQLWNRWVTWTDVALMFTLYVISGLGITIGFHRLMAHKSFETHWWLRRLFIMMGCLAVEGDPIVWASTHIQHHAHSDDDDDPHSPLKSLWHGHMGWLFDFMANPNVYGSWLRRDPDIVWVSKTWGWWALLGLAIPFAIGGVQGLIWGGLVRIFLTHHITWSVNSICHLFGSREYQTRDQSRNNFIVGLLAFGEGWHNNHHAFPRSAFHGLKWWQIDTSAYIIRTLEVLGLAWNVHRIKPEDLARRQLRENDLH